MPKSRPSNERDLAEIISELQSRFQLGEISHARYDKYYLVRFLVANDFDVDKTYRALLRHVDWRRREQIDWIHLSFAFPELSDVRRLYPHGFHGTDKKGRPIYIDRLGCVNVSALVKVTTHERLLRYWISDYEKTLEHRFPSCSKAAGYRIEQCLTILDLAGLKFSSFNSDARKMIKMLVRTADEHYPEVLGNFFIVNSPTIFSAMWAAIRPVLSSRTRAKISILGANFHSKLSHYVEIETLPTYLGGKCECPGGCLSTEVGIWTEPSNSVWVPWRTRGGAHDEHDDSFFTCSDGSIGRSLGSDVESPGPGYGYYEGGLHRVSSMSSYTIRDQCCDGLYEAKDSCFSGVQVAKDSCSSCFAGIRQSIFGGRRRTSQARRLSEIS